MKRIKCTVVCLLFVLLWSCSTDKTNDDSATIIDDNGNEQTVNVTENRKSVGTSAHDMLSQETFGSISFEIFYAANYKPTGATVDNFKNFLSQIIHKPDGITVSLEEINSPSKDVYSIEDIRAIEDSIRTTYNAEKNIAVFGLFLDGEYEENTEEGSVLGIAYRNTSFVIFENTIKEFSNQPFAPSTTVLESTVLQHEFGHLLGLVNAGTTPQSDHQDTAHGRHCTSEDCLMYWTAETGEGLLNSLSGGSIPDLDSACLEDLQANGGK